LAKIPPTEEGSIARTLFEPEGVRGSRFAMAGFIAIYCSIRCFPEQVAFALKAQFLPGHPGTGRTRR
jgi:hypothetical protein